jgi:hypothetical protein
MRCFLKTPDILQRHAGWLNPHFAGEKFGAHLGFGGEVGP